MEPTYGAGTLPPPFKLLLLLLLPLLLPLLLFLPLLLPLLLCLFFIPVFAILSLSILYKL